MKKFIIFCALMFVSAMSSALGAPDAVLTQEMLDEATNIFVIRKNYNLLGQTIVVPDGLSLSFVAGSVDNGELQGTNSRITVSGKSVFGFDLKISGTWNVSEVHDGWFAFDSSPEAISNQIISNILAFSNDSTFCHIFFEEDRKYFFEMPYKGAANVGDMVSYRMVDGKKKRNYGEIYNDEYSFLRIFTIPSHTHVTINNSLKLLPTNQGAYFIFWEYGKEDVTIDGKGIISGDNGTHLYDSPFAGNSFYGEWGHIFQCIRCKNFTFKDVTLADSFGDCVVFFGSSYPEESKPRWAAGFTMDNVKILRARRNGVAIGARQVRITNCHFEDCGKLHGTPPRSAIDFEPDHVKQYPELGNQEVLMEKCTFKNNYFDVASYMNNLSGYGEIATVIRDCHFTSSIKIQGTFWIRFENCYIPFVYNTKDNRSIMLNSKHMEFIECDFGQYDISALGLASNLTNKYKDCRFNTDKKE